MHWELPVDFEKRIDTLLAKYELSLNKTQKLANAILDLSDFYIQQPGEPTPWAKNSTIAAHLAYYFPLNFIRSRALLAEARRIGFLQSSDELIDFGAGLSPLAAANKSSVRCVESAEICADIFSELVPDVECNWYKTLEQVPRSQKQVLCLSYSLPELVTPPDWFFSYDRILLMEPSDRLTGRKLLQLRAQLLEKGYYIWAPCTHQLECPLLKDSKTDWCHTREFWKMPTWFQKIEQHLPMKNRTLSFAYLLASRTPPPAQLSQYARLTGDLLAEKGKARQLVCRSDRREFLAWLARDGDAPEMKRGELVKILDEPRIVGNELRVAPTQVSVVNEL